MTLLCLQRPCNTSLPLRDLLSGVCSCSQKEVSCTFWIRIFIPPGKPSLRAGEAKPILLRWAFPVWKPFTTTIPCRTCAATATRFFMIPVPWSINSSGNPILFTGSASTTKPLMSQSLYHTCQRYRTLHTHRITALPILVLMPHSGCNCRCVMCDIWKGNKHLKQLREEDIKGLLGFIKKWGTRQVLMSGGEALLHPLFFRFCALLKGYGVHITLLSTGLLVGRHREDLLRFVDDIIISLDGDEPLHDRIRNIPGAYQALKKGIGELRALQPAYPVTGRSVIHRLNFRSWPALVGSARELGLGRVSFLPADVSSTAFNRA